VDLGASTLAGSADSALSRGTEGYASPEQWGLDTADPKADLYSFGVVFFECLLGHLPPRLPGTGLFAWRRHVRSLYQILRRSEVESMLADLLMLLLQPNPRLRVGSATEVADRLKDWLEQN